MELVLIQEKICEIRNVRVMLDRDLAALYGVETRVLNQAVKRNIERFPDDFMFQLSEEEFADWKSQIVMSNSEKMGVRRRPYAFTELGVAMLSSVLQSQTAIQVNIAIMRTFVALRRLAQQRTDRFTMLERDVKRLRDYVEEILTDQNDINESVSVQLDLINEALAMLQVSGKDKPDRPRIGFI